MAKVVHPIVAPTGLELLQGFATLLQNPQKVIDFLESAKTARDEVNAKLERLGILEDAAKVMAVAKQQEDEAARRLQLAQEFDNESKARAERREQLFIAKDAEQNKMWGEKFAALDAKEKVLAEREGAVAAREAAIDGLRKDAETIKAQMEAAHVAAEAGLARIRDAAASLGR